MVVCDWNDCLNTFNTSDAIKLLNAEELSVSFWLPILVFMSLKTPPQMIAKKKGASFPAPVCCFNIQTNQFAKGGLKSWKNALGESAPPGAPFTVGRQVEGISTHVLFP